MRAQVTWFKDQGALPFVFGAMGTHGGLSEEAILEVLHDGLGDSKYFIKENLDVYVLFFNGRAIGITPPRSIDLKVTKCDPGVRGDTVSGAMKPATLETGYTLNVPLFVNEGDQVDVLNVFNGGSPSDDTAVLTEDHLGGLGMPDEAIIAGLTLKGGITYHHLEEVNLELGLGADHLVIESTHAGATTVNGGAGAGGVIAAA
mgnify:CR=1 FL=1